MLKDRFTVRMELSEDFDPKENERIKDIIDEISQTEKTDNEPVLTETLPFATFKQAEDLFSSFRDLAAETSTPITFKYLAIWEFDENEKPKMGSVGSGDGNPHEHITLPDIQIDFDYQNLTKFIFENIFNSPENDDISYDDKVKYCQEIKDAYMESCGVSENGIARIPEETETDKGSVELTVPSFSERSAKVDESSKTDDTPVFDPITKKFISANNAVETDTTTEQSAETTSQNPSMVNEHADNKVVSNNSHSSSVAQQPKPTPVVHHKRHTSSSTHNSRVKQQATNDTVANEVSLAQEKGQVFAPQFSVQVLDPVEPGQHGYVEYQVNQKKKTFNKYLQGIAKAISEKNEKAIISQNEKYRKLSDQAIANFKNSHKNDAQILHDQIQEKLYAQKQKDLEKEYEKIDTQRTTDLKAAKRAYDAQVEQIHNASKNNKVQAEVRLTKKYEQRAMNQFQKDLTAQQKANGKAESKLSQQLDRKYQIKSREDSANLRTIGTERLQKEFDRCNQQLDDFRTQVTSEHLNAKKVQTAEQNADTESKRVQAPYEEVRALNRQLNELKGTLGTVQASNKALKGKAADLETRLKSSNTELEAMRHQNAALTKEKIADQVAKKNDNTDDLFNKFLQLQLTKNLGNSNTDNNANNVPNQQATVEYQQAQAKIQQQNDQLSLIRKGTKRLFISLSIILLGVIAGSGYYIHHQNVIHQQEINVLTKQMNQKVNAAQATKNTPNQSEIDKKALVALHNNSLKELNKYKDETYYQLDKAIIDNNGSEVYNLLKSKDNLNLHDRYRASQAESLLNEAGNTALANQVKNANR